MPDYHRRANLEVDAALADFIESRALPGTEIASGQFWSAFAAALTTLAPRNRALLDVRADLQSKIDAWHVAHRGETLDADAYQKFLLDIGYLAPDVVDFSIETNDN